MAAIDVGGGFIRLNASGTEAKVCELIATRQHTGLAKYGVSVQDNQLTLREWLVHQQQELADALVYATRAIEELDKHGDDYK